MTDSEFDWREENGVWTASPDSRSVYACHRANYRSTKYFARYNGVSLARSRDHIFYGSLVKAKALCEEHHRNKGVRK